MPLLLWRFACLAHRSRLGPPSGVWPLRASAGAALGTRCGWHTPSERLSVAALNEDRLKQVSAQLTDGTEVQFGDKDFTKRVGRFIALLGSERESATHSIARIDLRYESGAAVLRKKQKFAVTAVSQEQGGQ